MQYPLNRQIADTCGVDYRSNKSGKNQHSEVDAHNEHQPKIKQRQGFLQLALRCRPQAAGVDLSPLPRKWVARSAGGC